jgi:hypothetical protein
MARARAVTSGTIGGLEEGLILCHEAPPVYRPRHPERPAFYQMLDEHLDRYEPRDKPLRLVVRPRLEALLDCGRLENGFARLRCPKGQAVRS